MILVVSQEDILQGVVYKLKLFEFPEEYRKSVKLESIMIKDPFFAYDSDSLHNALVRLSSNDLQLTAIILEINLLGQNNRAMFQYFHSRVKIILKDRMM